MKTLKKYNYEPLNKKFSLKKVYWTRSYFTRFFYYKNRNALSFSLHYLGFGFSYFGDIERVVNSVVKSLICNRFSFHFNLINPFFCIKMSLKEFLVNDSDTNYYFLNNRMFVNSLNSCNSIIKSFYSSVLFLGSTNIMINNTKNNILRIKMFTFLMQKSSALSNIQSNFLAIKLIRASCFFLFFLLQNN